MSKFNCTMCGGCCLNAHADYYIRQLGWVAPDGSCKQYIKETKQCAIYDTRPDTCVVSKRFPDEAQWGNVYNYCDQVHEYFYGVPREQEGECNHKLK